MAEWKKVLVSGSAADVTSLKLSSVSNAGTDTNKFLVLDSSGNVDFRTGTEVLSDIGAGTGGGDITAVTAGAGMTGGASTGAATLNVIGGDGITVGANEVEVAVDDTTIQLSNNNGSGTVKAKTAAIANAGTGLATADQIHTFVTTQTDAMAADTTGRAGTASALHTARNIAGVSFDGTANISLNNNAITNGAGYTTNVGDITGVTAGVGLSGGGTSGGVTLTLDMSELTDMTAEVDGEEDELILLDKGSDRRKLISEIGLSAFNNDSGFTTNTGDITAVTAGNGLSGGGSSGGVTLAVGVDGTTTQIVSDQVVAKTAAIANGGAGLATADQIHTFVTTQTDAIDADTAGNAATATALANARTIAGVSFDGTANISLNNNAITNGAGYTTNVGDITGVTAGTGLSGGGSSGGVTLAFDGTELSTHTIGDGSGTITIAGNLDVNGTTTTVDTTNLAVADKFIELNRGASSNGDGGIVINGSANRSFGWDDSADRWAFDFTGASATQTAISSDAFVAAVTVNGEGGIDGADANYQKNGNIMINGSKEIYIYVE